jgi:hypothetical protein
MRRFNRVYADEWFSLVDNGASFCEQRCLRAGRSHKGREILEVRID